MEAGLADRLRVLVYDASGALAGESSLTGPSSVVDGRYAFEWAWSGPDAGSGVYTAVAVASKAGHADLPARVKCALVR